METTNPAPSIHRTHQTHQTHQTHPSPLCPQIPILLVDGMECYRFFGCCFDPRDGTLKGPTQDAVTLRPKVATLLATIVHSPNEVVRKEDLIAAIWSGGVVDFEAGLSAALKELRSALAEVGLEKPPSEVIQTLPKRGVRLNANVERIVSAKDKPQHDTLPSKKALGEGQGLPQSPLQNPKRFVGPIVSILMALLVAIVLLRHDWTPTEQGLAPSGSQTLAILPFQVYGTSPDRAASQGLLAADAMLSQLWKASLPNTTLLGRASLLPYQGQSEGELVAALAKDLGASLLIEGRLVWEGDEVRIHARLVSTETFEILWSQSATATQSATLAENPAGAIEAAIEALVSPLSASWPIP